MDKLASRSTLSLLCYRFSLQAASKSGCSLAVLMGESELVAGSTIVKNMASGEQRAVSSLSELVALVEQQRRQSDVEPPVPQR
jgi:histidyl-tRNA synthetase